MAWIAVPAIISLAVYLLPVIVVRHASYPRADEYFVSSTTTTPSLFQNSAIAYQLQMATFLPFFAWGAAGDFWPAIVNSAFFAAGLLLLYNRRKPLFEFLETALHGQRSITVHEFIARHHGNSKWVRITASILTIVALFGLVLGESTGIAAIIKPLVPDNTYSLYAVVFGMLFLMFGYTVLSGNSGVMRSDQAQLAVAYVALFTCVLVLLFEIFTVANHQPDEVTAAVFGVGICCGFVVLNRRLQFLSTTRTATSRFWSASLYWFERAAQVAVIALAVSAFAFALAVLLRIGPLTSMAGTLRAFLAARTQVSWMGYLGLALLPLFYGFVDITNWQRLAAFEKSGPTTTGATPFRRAFKTYALESAVIWIFMCMFGAVAIATVAHGNDADLESFVQQVTTDGGVLGATIVSLLVAGGFAIALSTMSAVFSATLCAIRYDILPVINRRFATETVSDTSTEAVARHVTITAGVLFYLAVTYAFYLIANYTKLNISSDDFVSFLFAFYCAQLSFVPLILGPLVWRKGQAFASMSAPFAMACLIGGSLAGAGSIALFFMTGDGVWQWGAVPSCLAAGIVLFIVGINPRLHGWVVILLGSTAGAIALSIWGRWSDFWVIWEATGIVFTGVYAVIMWVSWNFPRPGVPPMCDLIAPQAFGRHWIYMLVGILALGGAFYVSVKDIMPIANIAALLVASGCFYGTQVQVRDYPREDLSERPHLRRAYEELHNDADNTIKYSELPTILAFVILAIFVAMAQLFPSINDQFLRSFVGGAVSFQLLLSNIIFGFNYGMRHPTIHSAVSN